MKIWYAVMMDKEDTDWGTGSHDLDEAMDMARRMGAESIAVIEDGTDPVCIDEIEVKENTMNKNQMVADKLNTMELTEMARNIINDTEIGMMDELFGSLETEEQVERFIREFYTDSFRVSAVWEDGTTVDNDIIYEVGEDAVKAELEVAREWFADRNPSEYMISYYFEGDVIGADMVKA